MPSKELSRNVLKKYMRKSFSRVKKMLNKTEIYICIYNKQETQVHSSMFYAFGNHQVTSYTFL